MIRNVIACLANRLLMRGLEPHTCNACGNTTFHRWVDKHGVTWEQRGRMTVAVAWVPGYIVNLIALLGKSA
jgi:hypothetical protein